MHGNAQSLRPRLALDRAQHAEQRGARVDSLHADASIGGSTNRRVAKGAEAALGEQKGLRGGKDARMNAANHLLEQRARQCRVRIDVVQRE